MLFFAQGLFESFIDWPPIEYIGPAVAICLFASGISSGKAAIKYLKEKDYEDEKKRTSAIALQQFNIIFSYCAVIFFTIYLIYQIISGLIGK